MEVILLESFNRLGKIGDIVKVKDGFARNYLIPQKKALRANKENKVHFTKIKQNLIEKNNKIIEEAKKSLKIISGEEIIFIRNASDNGQLYGSVSPKDISNYFNQKKIDIKPSNINLHSAIKKVGIYNINIKLHAEVTCDLKINVATSNENAKLQKSEVNKVDNPDEKDKSKKDEILLESKKSISEKKEINKKESEKIESIKKASAKSETKIKKEESDLEKDIKKKDK
jgi:large subunit ribosomal protein L9